MTKSLRMLCAAGCGLFLLVMNGCLGTAPEESSRASAGSIHVDVTDDRLKQKLDEVLEFTLQHRSLNTREHAAWQILHGALAYQLDFEVEHEGKQVSAVELILGGGKMTGWTVQPGVVLDEETGRRGLRAILEAGSKTGQGHYDQWLAVLAQCNLDRTQKIKLDNDYFTIQDYVDQVKYDVPRNLDSEFSWTLIGLTAYEPTDAKWTAGDDQEWSIERLLQSEVDFQIGEGACGGTHRLIGITMALSKHKENGGKVDGVWKQAEEVIEEAIQLARQHQNPDGTFSTSYIVVPGSSPDLAQNLGATGHVLEFLSLALPDERLKEDWVQLAAIKLCEIFEKTKDVPLECGALYHAAHGLVLYRERLYGARRYTMDGEANTLSTAP